MSQYWLQIKLLSDGEWCSLEFLQLRNKITFYDGGNRVRIEDVDILVSTSFHSDQLKFISCS